LPCLSSEHCHPLCGGAVSSDEFPEIELSKGDEISLHEVHCRYCDKEDFDIRVVRGRTKLGVTPIVLPEKPDDGLTIIEEFERYAKVGFAIVLMIPDEHTSGQKKAETVFHPVHLWLKDA